MKLLDIKQKLNKKFIFLCLVRLVIAGLTTYGAVAGYNNGKAFTIRSYNQFISNQAKALHIVEHQTDVHYVVDPVQAAEIITTSASAGAKAGADESIKANLGK